MSQSQVDAPVWHDVASWDAVPEGLSQHRVGTAMVLLVRQGDRLHATEPLCPHKFAALADGELLDGCIRCPQHEAHFDPSTGEPQEGEEWAGTLRTFPCRVEAGKAQVDLD